MNVFFGNNKIFYKNDYIFYLKINKHQHILIYYYSWSSKLRASRADGSRWAAPRLRRAAEF